MQAVETQILSDITHFSKYARYLPELERRETFTETATRNMEMHIKRYPHLAEYIKYIYKEFVFTKKVLPSMRSMQFGGKPIEITESRIFNCAAVAVDDPAAFSEAMFLLLGGTGLGYSVQSHHINRLPAVSRPTGERKYLVSDTIEGWADAVKVLIKAYLGNYAYRPIFDFSDIRPKGARLVTSGGKAPGHEPLKRCLELIQEILAAKAEGSKLTPIEAHDIMCLIADAVLAGGIRRAAMISLFDWDDKEMLIAKSGAWWEHAPHRARANNSVLLLRKETTYERFMTIWNIVQESGAGEPGFFWSDTKEMLTNPCAEVSLLSAQFCNLVEINASTIESQRDLEERADAAAFISTLQAGYTDFHYLRPIWRENTEREALIGVGATGIASGNFQRFNLERAVEIIKQTNQNTAKTIGINSAARCTVVKPAGTTSLILGSSSGIHAWHDKYYIRRMRVNKAEAIYTYLAIYHPELIEDDVTAPNVTAVLSVPQRAPEGAVTREESTFELLDRVLDVSKRWIHPGHISGANRNNVSATISVKQDEWSTVGEWLWDNRNEYTGLSVLPYFAADTTYAQLPFETITKEQFETMVSELHTIDLTRVIEMDDSTDATGELACAGGGNGCEVLAA